MSRVLYHSANDENISRTGDRQRAVQFEDELEHLRERVRKQQVRDVELRLSPAPPVKTRKVASAPAPKSYPGFSTPGQHQQQQQSPSAAPPAAALEDAANLVNRRARAVTPSDWRRGLELSQRELGPAPPLPKPPASQQQQQQQQTESSGKKTATVRPHPRPAPSQPPPPTSDQEQQQQRNRHYDQEEIKEYLQQQKERRRQAKLEAERQRAANAAALRQKLQDLRQRQLEAVASGGKPTTSSGGRRSAPTPLRAVMVEHDADEAAATSPLAAAEPQKHMPQARKKRNSRAQKRQEKRQPPPAAAFAKHSSGGSASPRVETDDNVDENDYSDEHRSPSPQSVHYQPQQQQPSADTLYRWCAVRDAASSLEHRVSRMARPGGEFWATMHPPHLFAASASAALIPPQLPLPGYRESPPAPVGRAVTPAEADTDADAGIRLGGDNDYEYAAAQRLADRMPQGLDRIGRALLLQNYCVSQPQQQQPPPRQRSSQIGRRSRRSEGTTQPKSCNLLHTLEHESADPFAFRAVYNRQREAFARRQSGGQGSPTPAAVSTRHRRSDPRDSASARVGGDGMMDGSMRPEDLKTSPSAAATRPIPVRDVRDRDVQTAPLTSTMPIPTVVAASSTDIADVDRNVRRSRQQRQPAASRSRSRSRSVSESGEEAKDEELDDARRRRRVSPPPAVASRRFHSQSRPHDGRLSPASLERMFQVELQFYDSLEESHRQLTELDRHRQVALSNQETVALAQVLKANRFGQAQEAAAARTAQDKDVQEAKALVAEAKAKNTRLEEETTSRLAKIRDENLRLNAILAQFQAKPAIVLREDATQTATSTPKPRRSAAAAVPAAPATVTPSAQQQQRKEKVTGVGATVIAPPSKPQQPVESTIDEEDFTITSGADAVEPAVAAAAAAVHDISSASTTLLTTTTASQSLLQAADATDVEEEVTEVYDEDYDDVDAEDDKSLREVLPSESQRRRTVKRQRKSGAAAATPASALAPIIRADASYERLTQDIARMYQQDEAGRRAYQAKLLALRQRSAKETAKKSLIFLRSLANGGGAAMEQHEVWPKEKIAANERLVFEQYRLEKQQIRALRQLHGLQQRQQQQKQKPRQPSDKKEEVDDDEEADTSSLSQLDRQMRKLRPDSLTPREQRLHQRRQESRELISWQSAASSAAASAPSRDVKKRAQAPAAAAAAAAKTARDGPSATAKEVDSDSGSSTSTLTSRNRPVATRSKPAAAAGRSSPSPSSTASSTTASIATEVQPTVSRSYAESFEEDSASAAPVDTARSSARTVTESATVVDTQFSKAATTPRTANETTVNETEVSEYEARIQALTRQMQERQQMLKRLKREHSRVSKDQLRQKERELVRRIEAYDKNIADLEKDLRRAAQGGKGSATTSSSETSESASAQTGSRRSGGDRAGKSSATESAVSADPRRDAHASSATTSTASPLASPRKASSAASPIASPRKASSAASPASAPTSARSPRTPRNQTASMAEAVEEEVDEAASSGEPATTPRALSTARSRRTNSTSSMTEEIEAAADSESSSTTVSGSRRVSASASAAAVSAQEDIPPSSDSAGAGGAGAYSEDFEADKASSASASVSSSGGSQRRQVLDSRDDSVRTASRQVTVSSEPERDLRRHEDAEEASASAAVVDDEEDVHSGDDGQPASARTPRTPRVVNFSEINEEYSFNSDDEKRPAQKPKSPSKRPSPRIELAKNEERQNYDEEEKDKEDEEDVPMSARTIPSEMSDLPSEASESAPSGRGQPASELESAKRDSSAAAIEEEEDIAEELPFDEVEEEENEAPRQLDETTRAASPLLIFDEKPPTSVLPTDVVAAEDDLTDNQLATAIQEASLHRSELRADQLSDELTHQLLAGALNEAVELRRRRRDTAAALPAAKPSQPSPSPPIPPRPPTGSVGHALLDEDMWEEDLLDVAAAAKRPQPASGSASSATAEVREAPPTPPLTPALPLTAPPPPTPLVPSSEAEVAELAGHSLRSQLARLSSGQPLDDEAPEELVAMATLDPSAVAAAAAVAASVESPDDEDEDDEGNSSAAANVVATATKAGRAFAVGIHQLVTDELREVLQLPQPPLPPAPVIEPAPGDEGAPAPAGGPADWEPPERTRYFLRPRFRRRPPSDEAELVEAVRQRLASVPGVRRLSSETSSTAEAQLRPAPAQQRIGKLQAWSAMKRRDRVDQVLVEELRQEEPGWVDYEVDETEAKLKVADEILAQLLSDTVSCLRSLQG